MSCHLPLVSSKSGRRVLVCRVAWALRCLYVGGKDEYISGRNSHRRLLQRDALPHANRQHVLTRSNRASPGRIRHNQVSLSSPL